MPLIVWRFDKLSSLRVYSHHKSAAPASQEFYWCLSMP